MGMFTIIPENTFNALQLDAGVLLKNFDPASPAVTDANIICATTGGIQASCVPTYSDLGEDVDNCPVNMKELKHLDSWECRISTTSLGTSAELIRMALGAADITATSGMITPRKDLEQTDFSDLWWVGDRADGGFVAIQLKNALSTGGFSLQTTKNGKGQISIELTGHVSINAQSVMPMVFYSLGAASGSISLDKVVAIVEENGTITLNAATTPATAVVTWASDDSTEASVAASGSSPYHTATVTGVDEGTVTITASTTVDSTTYTAKCVVTVVAASN